MGQLLLTALICITLAVSTQAAVYIPRKKHVSLREQLLPYYYQNNGINSVKHELMYQKFITRIANQALGSWTNAQDQIQSLKHQIDAIKEEKIESEHTIKSMNDKIHDQSNEIGEWEKKYAELRGKYSEATAKFGNNINMHQSTKNSLTQQKNNNDSSQKTFKQRYQVSIIAAGIMLILSIIGYPLYSFITNKNEVRSTIITALSPRTTRQILKKNPNDPLSSIIVMDNDTPTNSRPISPNPSHSVTFNNNAIVFEEHEVKVSEIPDCIR